MRARPVGGKATLRALVMMMLSFTRLTLADVSCTFYIHVKLQRKDGFEEENFKTGIRSHG